MGTLGPMQIPAALTADASRVRAAVFERLVGAYGPAAAGMFPEGASQVPQVLLDACVFTLTHSHTPELTDAVAERMRAWALDLRRVGFPAAEYPAVAGMVADASGADDDARAALIAAAEVMREAAEAADLAGIAPAVAAQVTDVTQTLSGVALVRCESGMPVAYLPGQVLPAMQVGRQGVWRGVIPALPANGYGQLEFHVPRADAGGFDLAVGDYLTLGAPRGAAPRLEGERAVIVGVGTGAAAARALVFSLLERDTRPETHCILAGDAPEDIYDAGTFAALAAAQPWLTVTLAAQREGEWRKVVTRRASASVERVVAPLGELLADAGDVVLCGAESDLAELRGLVSGAQVVAHDADPGWFVRL